MYYYLRETIVKTSIKNVAVREFTWAKKKLYDSLTDVLKKIRLICPDLAVSEVLKLSKEDVAKIMQAKGEVNRLRPSKVPSGSGERKKLLTIDSCIEILSQRWGGGHPMIIAHNYSEQMIRDWLDDILLREREEKEKDAPKGKIEDALNNKDLQKFKEDYLKMQKGK